jgi:hypothetical protein
MKKVLVTVLFTIVVVGMANELKAQSGPYQYYSLSPCRVVDTRNAAGTNGGPALGTVARDFQIRGTCGVPLSAHAVAVNITVTSASSSSWLTIWPSGSAKPFVSTINFDPTTPALANGAIVGLSANTNDLSVANAIGNVHLIIDVTGYFQ